MVLQLQCKMGKISLISVYYAFCMLQCLNNYAYVLLGKKSQASNPEALLNRFLCLIPFFFTGNKTEIGSKSWLQLVPNDINCLCTIQFVATTSLWGPTAHTSFKQTKKQYNKNSSSAVSAAVHVRQQGSITSAFTSVPAVPAGKCTSKQCTETNGSLIKY